MAKYVAKKYKLNDKRKDKAYSDWNVMLKEYEDATGPLVRDIRGK